MENQQPIFLGLGANLPAADGSTPLETCQKAITLLAAEKVHIQAVSKVYESAPWPPSDQPWYINAVARVETALEPEGLMALLLKTEAALGRKRGVKNDPRIIDLDIIDFRGLIVPGREKWRAGGKSLILPHLRAHERVFVLKPLLDLSPGWVHPVFGKSGRELLSGLPTAGQIRPAKGALKIP